MTLILLFSQEINLEQMEWIHEILIKISPLYPVHIYLTGDSLYSLVDNRTAHKWENILINNSNWITIDSWEQELLGITIKNLVQSFPNQVILSRNSNSGHSTLSFWELFIEQTQIYNSNKEFCFLQLQGPYMFRTSVFSLRMLEAAIKNETYQKINLFSYLDGIHMGHANQNPSEFENIGENIKKLSIFAQNSEKKLNLIACSRCATARGYWDNYRQKNDVNHLEVIDKFYIRNLNKIVDTFEQNNLIISAVSGFLTFDIKRKDDKGKEKKPSILIFVTHSPYGTEYTFGAISFAIACATHEIKTDIVFIEDGVSNLIGNHRIKESDHIFNVQEIVNATIDMDCLKYHVYKPSLDIRGYSLSENLKKIGLSILDANNLSDLILNKKNKQYNMKRLLFF